MTVDVRERLRRILGPAAAPVRPPGDDQPPASPRQAPRPPARTGPSIEQLVRGTVHEDADGVCFVAEHGFPLDHRHGSERLGGFLEIAGRALGCLAREPRLSQIDHRTILFLDTETTGLSGGTGTFVFLVGAGWFEDSRFVVRQYFMRHHAEEPTMLNALGDLFGRFRSVVTFNGKAFDVPLLETRFVASRRRCAIPGAPHFDLLFPTRRFWRGRLESCSLSSVEQHVLGHARHRDVPSWLIPRLYFEYVRDGDARPMVRVFRHNLSDILSLVSLACRLGRALGDPHAHAVDAHELMAVARLYEDLGLHDDALTCYERALEWGVEGPPGDALAVRLAMLARRLGQPERAVELWAQLGRTGTAGCLPLVELAKHYEHRVRDYQRAIALVEQALTIVELSAARTGSADAWRRRELEHRLARLLRKQAGLSARAR